MCIIRRAATTCKLCLLMSLGVQSCQLHIEAERRIALVECRLTLDSVAEQEYH